ncbi:hypothetical protein NDU88_001458 [Pleurodeles waltl]|uniref:Uncharacterized protein n=1 Tax=Pleurodeles waltl TaxID=8319 RepID=A0AAV7W0A8_PLEWA|nr:hypothetical protein NDU88_001458 [Pleurodeles waltl]
MFYPGSHSWDQRRNFQAFEVSQSKQDKYDKYSSYKGENPINHLYEGESQNYNPHEDEYSMYPLGPADNQNYPLYNGKNTKFPSYTGENQNLFQHESGYTNYRPYSEGHSEFSTYREANSKYTPYNPPEQQGNVYYSVDRIYNVGEHSPYDVLPPWNEGNRSPNINLEPPGNEANLPYPSSGPMRNTFSHQINPYEVAHPWETKDNGLVYGKEHPKNYENTRYHSGAPFVQREALLYPTGNSWDSGNHIPVHRESPTHAQTQLWDSNVDKHIRGPTEISPHTGGYPTDPRRVPSHSKGAMWNYGESQIAGFSSLEQRYHGKTVSGSEGNPTVYREAARDLSLNPLCCKGNFPVTSENAFPKNDDSPYISLPLWEKQERISYHVNSHSKHARHVEYTSGIEASQGNNSSLTDGQVTGMEEMMLPLKVEKLTEEGGGARYNNHSSQGGERSSNAETDATKLESGYFPGQNIVADVHNATAPRLQENKFVRRNKVTVSIPRKVCAGSANARHGISRGASPEGTKKKYVSTNNYMEQSPKQTLRRVLCFKGKLSSMSVDDKNTSALDHTLNPLPAEQSLPTRKPTVRLNSTRKSILPAMVKQDIPHSSNSPSGKTPQAKERTSGYKASEMYP